MGESETAAAIQAEIGRLLDEATEFDFSKAQTMVAATRWWQRSLETIQEAAIATSSARVVERKLRALSLPRVTSKLRAYVASSENAVLFRTSMHHVITLLIDTDEALAGRLGPPGLSGGELHHWVWNDRVERLWNDGHLREAVAKAATRIEEELRDKLGSTFSGRALASEAFSQTESGASATAAR